MMLSIKWLQGQVLDQLNKRSISKHGLKRSTGALETQPVDIAIAKVFANVYHYIKLAFWVTGELLGRNYRNLLQE